MAPAASPRSSAAGAAHAGRREVSARCEERPGRGGARPGRRRPRRRFASAIGRSGALRTLVALLLSFVILARPVLADDQPQVLRDTETEAFLDKIAAPLAKAAGMQPGALQIVILQDPEINAFVAGGQTIYLQTGLLLAAKNANELEGVLAHELGHIEAGDAVRTGDVIKTSSRISLLSLVLGAAAIAAGAGEAGMAAMAAGQQAGMEHFLSYSRQQEGSADASAVRHLADAHLSGKGMVSFFGTLKAEEYRLSSSYEATDPYLQDHPMTADRQAMLETALQKSPWWNAPQDPAKQAEFLRIKAKLFGFVKDPTTTMRTYPDSDQSVPAHYARAYAWQRGAYPEKALEEADALLATAPQDPYFNELKGQFLLEDGHPAQAIAPLAIASANSRHAPLIDALYGHALLETGDPGNFPQAEKVLKLSVARDREDPLAWFALGTVYAREGDEPRAALATAERYAMDGQYGLARINAETAIRGLPQGSPDAIRAEDIAVTARNQMDDGSK